MLYPFTKPPQVAPANGPISNPLNLDRSKSVSSARGIEKPLELRCPESKALTITETELKLMAAAAIIGFKSSPKAG